jgi:hypothetical protein
MLCRRRGDDRASRLHFASAAWHGPIDGVADRHGEARVARASEAIRPSSAPGRCPRRNAMPGFTRTASRSGGFPGLNPRSAAALVAAALLFATLATAAGTQAKGTFVYKGKTATLAHAYLVKGPDSVSKQTIRRLILSATDLEAKIRACKTMSCTDGDLGEGLSINLDAGSRLEYWMVMNDQRVQYSGTEPAASLTAKGNEPGRIAGTLRFDKTAAGGPRVDVEFDAALVKEVSSP